MPEPVDQQFIELCSLRWSLPVLTNIGTGARFTDLLHATSTGKDALSRTLRRLVELGLVRKNPGYGHPLRPEYLLTDLGAALCSDCVSLMNVLIDHDLTDICLQKWSLPVMVATEQSGSAFSAVKARLPKATARALSLSLKLLMSNRLLHDISAEHKTRIIYQPTNIGTLVKDHAVPVQTKLAHAA